MANRIPASVTIGGPIPRAALPEICEAVEAQGLGYEWGEYNARPTPDYVAGLQGSTLFLCDDESSGGLYDEVLPVLERHEVEFDFQSDARYEFDGVLRRARRVDGEYRTYEDLATQDGSPVLLVEHVRNVLEQMATFEDPAGAVAYGRDTLSVDVPDLPPIEVTD